MAKGVVLGHFYMFGSYESTNTISLLEISNFNILVTEDVIYK